MKHIDMQTVQVGNMIISRRDEKYVGFELFASLNNSSLLSVLARLSWEN